MKKKQNKIPTQLENTKIFKWFYYSNFAMFFLSSRFSFGTEKQIVFSVLFFFFFEFLVDENYEMCFKLMARKIHYSCHSHCRKQTRMRNMKWEKKNRNDFDCCRILSFSLLFDFQLDFMLRTPNRPNTSFLLSFFLSFFFHHHYVIRFALHCFHWNVCLNFTF